MFRQELLDLSALGNADQIDLIVAPEDEVICLLLLRI
jgi:hypothetical protein